MSSGRKRGRVGRIFGYSHAYSTNGPLLRADMVALLACIESPEDKGREITLKMTPADARRWARALVQMADEVDGGAPEAEQVPARPTGRLAELLGLSEGESND